MRKRLGYFPPEMLKALGPDQQKVVDLHEKLHLDLHTKDVVTNDTGKSSK
jgi:hypothetical protein